MSLKFSRAALRGLLAGALLVSMGSCGGSNDGGKEPGPTTTTTVKKRTKNAALNWSVNPPVGTVKPGGTGPKGVTIRPVRD